MPQTRGTLDQEFAVRWRHTRRAPRGRAAAMARPRRRGVSECRLTGKITNGLSLRWCSNPHAGGVGAGEG